MMDASCTSSASSAPSQIGAGDLPDDTILTCSRGSDSAFEFLSTCKISNLTIRAELGCCLLHRSGRLTIEGCILQCEENPLDYLSFPIMSTASGKGDAFPSLLNEQSVKIGDSVTVSETRIEGGARAVWTSGNLVLQHVRAIYAAYTDCHLFLVSQSKTWNM